MKTQAESKWQLGSGTTGWECAQLTGFPGLPLPPLSYVGIGPKPVYRVVSTLNVFDSEITERAPLISTLTFARFGTADGSSLRTRNQILQLDI